MSNLATLGKHLEMVFVQHILLCFNRRCQGSSFTATQDCRRCWETVPLPAFKKRKKKIPAICCSRGRILLGDAVKLPIAALGASRLAGEVSPRRFAGEVGGLEHGAGPLALPVGQGPPRPAGKGTALCSASALKALPSEGRAAAWDKL